MCGIVGAVAQRNVSAILVEGLKRLEYRGYDSAGVAIVADEGIKICKRQGKISNIEKALEENPIKGTTGIGHTRWATHGKPSETNSHPHLSYNQRIVAVHNGIIENYETLKQGLVAKNIAFVSETDSEVVAHFIADLIDNGKALFDAVKIAAKQFEGNNGIAVIDQQHPDRMIVVRSGSPLVIGVGIEENFIASDVLALRQVTDRFIILDEGDLAEITRESIRIFDANGKQVERPIEQISGDDGIAEKDGHSHYMYKEMYEQPAVMAKTLAGRLTSKGVVDSLFGEASDGAKQKLATIDNIHIVACGTSYHAGMIAKHWIEDLAEIPCSIDIASEYRYHKVLMSKNTLFLSVSQSGETADTLAALRARKEQYKTTMTICNVDNSSLVRESDLKLLTHAGPEIGVASTKAFTTQLAALQVLAIYLAQLKGISKEKSAQWAESLQQLEKVAQASLGLDEDLQEIAQQFANKHHTLFLGRGVMYPVALEGALKLKEISYIHAEAYAAGELKHGPLALVDDDMPVVAVAPNNELLEKLKSNLQEVKARGGKLYVFADKNQALKMKKAWLLFNCPMCLKT